MLAGRTLSAHVVPDLPTKHKRPFHGATHALNRWRGQTCDSDQPRDVALRWQVVGYMRDSVYLQEFTQQLTSDPTLKTDFLQAWQELRSMSATTEHLIEVPDCLPLVSATEDATVILSQAAKRHLEQFPGHSLASIGRNPAEPVILLDIPLPR
eukprot:s3485_g2.t1